MTILMFLPQRGKLNLDEKKLHDIIEGAVKQFGISIPEIVIELPKEEAFGDLATPAAMSLASVLKNHRGK